MDLRNELIQKITEDLSTKLGEDVFDMISDVIQDVLIVNLNDYELQERCTSIAILDNSAEGQLKKFVAVKRIEGIADSTLRRYADENMKLLRFLNKPLYKITTYDIRFYLSYRRQQGTVSNRTLNGMRRCYSSFFSWLAAEGLIAHNPCLALSQIKFKKQVKKPFSSTEIDALRMNCNNIRDLALVDFLYSTGCRVSEVVKLNISDINFEKLECTVLGKGNKERKVYITEVTAKNLKEYIKTRKIVGQALFTGKGSSRLTKNGIEAAIKRIGKAAGVENVHPHRFRRTLATNLLDRGMNIQDVATILGHADLKTTQIYCYISQSNVQAAYRKYAA